MTDEPSRPAGTATPPTASSKRRPSTGRQKPLRQQAPRDTTYTPGYVIGTKYRLERVLGEGGMGSVWLATNLTLDVSVAVKLVRREIADDEATERLLIEARAAARLDHPSVVKVFDFGRTERGDSYIVMEVVRGESLADILDRKGRLPAIRAVQLLLPVAGALSVAHTRGIVHRDVKPENIILQSGDGGHLIPKLVDFGIAKVDERMDARGRPLTAVGVVMGSPDYMSPEQAMSKSDVDERADVWALCIVLYETICGQRPFAGDSFAELCKNILTQDPKPTTDFAAGDDKLWRLIRRGLERHREDRWKSMRALGSLLAQWAYDKGTDTDVAGSSLEAQWLSEGAAGMLSAPAPEEGERSRRPVEITPATSKVVHVSGSDIVVRLSALPTQRRRRYTAVAALLAGLVASLVAYAVTTSDGDAETVDAAPAEVIGAPESVADPKDETTDAETSEDPAPPVGATAAPTATAALGSAAASAEPADSAASDDRPPPVQRRRRWRRAAPDDPGF